MCVPCVTQTGRWNNASCSELSTFICCMPKAHYRLPSVKPMVYGCPQVGKNIGDTLTYIYTHRASLTRFCLALMHQGWDTYEYSCYWMKEMPRCWLDAKQFCKAQDTDLVRIGDL